MFSRPPTLFGKSAGRSCTAGRAVIGGALTLFLSLLCIPAMAQDPPPNVTGAAQQTPVSGASQQIQSSIEDYGVITLSPGDKLRISVSGLGGEDLSGDYVVNLHTALEIPYISPLPVAGLTAPQVEEALSKRLLDERILRDGFFRVSVQVLEYAAIKVNVTGAVFEPGEVVINDQAGNGGSSKELIPGDNPMDRYLTAAILAAGGVTPRADIHNVKLLRPGREALVLDLSGLFSGEPVQNIPLIAGDTVFVPDSGRFQTEIVRPSPITPKEVSTYVSNVTQPRSIRTTLETTDRVVNVTLFYYGTRLAQAVIAAQCAGGTRATNAARKVLFVHTDEATGETTSVERSIRALLSENGHMRDGAKNSPADSDLAQLEFNPYLMPRDGIICYDSGVTNISEFFIAVGSVLLPFNIWKNIVD